MRITRIVRPAFFAAILALVCLTAICTTARAESITFTATLTGSQETPPNVSTAMGQGIFVLNAAMNSLTFDVTYSGLSANAVASHFHTGPPGVAGPVVHGVSIPPGPMGELIGVWDNTGTQPLTPVLVAQLLAGNIYFNIHTTNFPGGEIRGQLIQAVPEPNMIALLAIGILGFLIVHRRYARA